MILMIKNTLFSEDNPSMFLSVMSLSVLIVLCKMFDKTASYSFDCSTNLPVEEDDSILMKTSKTYR